MSAETEHIMMPSRLESVPPMRLISLLVWLALMFVVCCGVLTFVWASESEPPFKLKSFHIDSEAVAGKSVRITMQVERDPARHCDVVVSRFVQDSKGYRSYSDSQSLSSMDIALIEQTNPGVAKINVPIPASAAPGDALIGTTLQYTCNPFHKFFPIFVAMAIPVTIAETKP